MTVLAIIALVVWVFILASVILDIVRRSDLDGMATTLWIAFIVVLPLIGVIAYLIARPSVAPDEQADVSAYEAKVVPHGEQRAEAIADLTRRHEEGELTDEEYQEQRRALESPD